MAVFSVHPVFVILPILVAIVVGGLVVFAAVALFTRKPESD
jgi:hypothetical protein